MTPLRIWYVAAQRLCNLDCPYCVSVGSWSKSRRYDWEAPADRDAFAEIVSWIGARPFEVSLRLGSLGEPFASPFFLQQAAWLTRRPNVRFVELLSNAALLQRRLPTMESTANLGKLSLWLTWHRTQMSMEKFIAAAEFAQRAYGCFVVVNALLFSSGDIDDLQRLSDAADQAGLRFNLDLGYDPYAPSRTSSATEPTRTVPAIRDHGSATQVIDAVSAAGGDPELTRVTLLSLKSPKGRPCRSGHDYLFIDIHGNAYRCSRYSTLDRDCYGNVLDPDFDLRLRPQTWAPCDAAGSCCNKEDFLNLKAAADLYQRDVPSLGWTDA
ncbi:hypothetical protein [Actinomadura sp. WMMB 499]|uniref:hypothetical protein n=1 Tax=Actinomadura sp. WMMB 499 TaxID=1219491 RepID=UPI0012450FAB|nr:hypothetical protein [Actinomadura sp. WMMB 499]QFG23731.1 hypothetical protein F7P10_23995 [Actinomadura sp. WMMB 499]